MTLVLDHVDKSFGTKNVIQDLNLQISQGEVFGFLGPNGAGKTTTMRMVLDIIKPDRGSITWKGQKVNLETARTFGYLPEERGLYPKMKVEDQLRFFARLRGIPHKEAEKRITHWVERFQLGDLVLKKANELSKGNQQKVQFLLAILHQPQLLILDEPFSGLDPVNAEILKSAFCDLAKEGKTIIFSSHRMEHVEELCDSLCIIQGGGIIAQGSVSAVRKMTGRKIVYLKVQGSLEFLDQFALKERRIVSQDDEGVVEVRFDINDRIDPQEILHEAIRQGQVHRFEIGEPSLNETFITLVGGEK